MGEERGTMSTLVAVCTAAAISVALTLGTLTLSDRAHAHVGPPAFDDATSAGQA